MNRQKAKFNTIQSETRFGNTGPLLSDNARSSYPSIGGNPVTLSFMLSNFFSPVSGIACFENQQPSGTGGGDIQTAGGNTDIQNTYIRRILNTTVFNNINGCYLTGSNQIYLPPGSYSIQAILICKLISSNSALNMLASSIINNDSKGTTIANGTVQNFQFGSASAAAINDPVYIYHPFITFTSPTLISTAHQANVSMSGNGQGIPAGIDTEVFSSVIVFQWVTV